METTVEGVENREQCEAVRLEGCTEVQGFWVSRAVPAEQLSVFLGATGDDRVDAA
jgi:EAL domain-containing protein (putative c-di-GMP-specific phosphodiesterase class I)